MSSRGKWSEESVPHKGWIHLHTEDLGEAEATCDMCGKQDIRYVHHMSHSRYDGILEVGCVCAENMAEEYKDIIRSEEQALKRKAQNKAQKRKRFPHLKDWRISKKGNPYINYKGYNIAVFPENNGWGGRVISDSNGKRTKSQKIYDSDEKVKLAIYDAMQKGKI